MKKLFVILFIIGLCSLLMGQFAGNPVTIGPGALGSGTAATLSPPSSMFVCTNTCTVTPPLPVPGYQFCVFNDDNVSSVITLAGVTGVQYEATARTSYGTAGHTITSAGAVKDMICIIGRDSTHYLTTNFSGTWTNN